MHYTSQRHSHQFIEAYHTVGTLEKRCSCLVSDYLQKPPPMSSTTHPLPPPPSGLNVYFASHKKSSSQVPQNVISLGTFRELGAFFLFFASIDRELRSLHICGRISVKFAKVQDLGFGFGACVNRRRAGSRHYRPLAPVRPKSRNHELAFTEI